MARDRDHQAVAARTLAEGRRLLAAWDNYVDAARAAANVVQCSSVDEATGLLCQLLEGHAQGEAPTAHRHRMLGTQAVVTW